MSILLEESNASTGERICSRAGLSFGMRADLAKLNHLPSNCVVAVRK
jgi:hypothetical protein